MLHFFLCQSKNITAFQREELVFFFFFFFFFFYKCLHDQGVVLTSRLFVRKYCQLLWPLESNRKYLGLSGCFLKGCCCSIYVKLECTVHRFYTNPRLNDVFVFIESVAVNFQ